MSRPIGRFESFLDWVVRFLMVMAALAVTAYIGWYGWVITTGEPISNPTTRHSLARRRSVGSCCASRPTTGHVSWGHSISIC